MYSGANSFEGDMTLSGSLFITSTLFDSTTKHSNAQILNSSQLFDSTTKHSNAQILNSSQLFDSTIYTQAVKTSFASFINRLDSINIYFGINATQDTNYLYIKKSDLIGLNPNVNNSAESLLIAILLNALNVFSIYDENNIDFSDLYLFRWRDLIVTKSNIIYFRYTIVIQKYTKYGV